MNLNDYRSDKVLVLREEDIGLNGNPKGSTQRFMMADLVLTEVNESERTFLIAKDRYGDSFGNVITLDHETFAKLLLVGAVL